jgi:hypothetical protein
MDIKWSPYVVPVDHIEMPKDEFGEFFFYPTPRVTLSKDLRGIPYYSSLVHELLEMINAVYELGLSETKIRILETSLMQLMCQNPEILTSLGMALQGPGAQDRPKVPPSVPEPSNGLLEALNECWKTAKVGDQVLWDRKCYRSE